MSDLLAAEVLKLRTTRTPVALLAATVTVNALAVASAVIPDTGAVDLESTRGVRLILSSAGGGSIFVLVLGVIITAGEFRHGTAVDTFLTTPRRTRVIAIKVATATIAGSAFGAVSAGTSMAAAALSYQAKDGTLPIGSADLWSTLGGSILYAALFGTIGAATGSLIRNQVAAIVGWLAWLAVVEHIAVGFVSAIGRWLPGAAGLALVRAPRDDLLSQAAAAVVLALYAAVIAVAAIALERGRDA